MSGVDQAALSEYRVNIAKISLFLTSLLTFIYFFSYLYSSSHLTDILVFYIIELLYTVAKGFIILFLLVLYICLIRETIHYCC